jgi:peptidoglycan hydrolase-like protein with peptidoglycan-binding domain
MARQRWATLAVPALLLLTACGPTLFGTESADGPAEQTPPSAPPTTVPPTTSTTAAAATAAPLPPAAPAALASPAAVEQRLTALRFDVANADGAFDDSTRHAVTAFQKLHGLPRTGRPTPDVLAALASAQLPPPLVPGGAPTRVEIDLSRQVILLWVNGDLHKVLPTSTGSGRRFCAEGECGVAVTPRGTFQVERRISGWRESRLGRLFNPLYFTGGIAIHGFPTVPVSPASHGCVRIPMASAGWFPQVVPNGTPVHVV